MFALLTVDELVSRDLEIERLLLRIANDDGKREAFGRLYELISTDVYAYALSKTGDEADAEDITEECFVKIYKFAPQYKPKGKPMAWIFTVAINLFKRQRIIKSRHIALDDEMGENLKDDSISPESIAVNNDLVNILLKTLTDSERDVVIMHAVSGLKHREIARLLDEPLSTVLSRYNRAIKKLKEKCEKGGVL